MSDRDIALAIVHVATSDDWSLTDPVEFAIEKIAEARAETVRRCAQIADSHASVEGIAQAIRDEIRKEFSL